MPQILHNSPIVQESLEHGFQVARIAGHMFQGFASLHGLDEEWGRILQVAARLHDIGWFYGKTGHHKNSAAFIVKGTSDEVSHGLFSPMCFVFNSVFEAEEAFFEKHRRVLVALVARYHRRAEPSHKHKYFKDLPEEEQVAVQKLAAIIRLADALDFSHASCVHNVTVHTEASHVYLDVECQSDCHAEIARIQQKKELFVKVFSRDVLCRRI